jgi:hypothetical protein
VHHLRGAGREHLSVSSPLEGAATRQRCRGLSGQQACLSRCDPDSSWVDNVFRSLFGPACREREEREDLFFFIGSTATTALTPITITPCMHSRYDGDSLETLLSWRLGGAVTKLHAYVVESGAGMRVAAIGNKDRVKVSQGRRPLGRQPPSMRSPHV